MFRVLLADAKIQKQAQIAAVVSNFICNFTPTSTPTTIQPVMTINKTPRLWMSVLLMLMSLCVLAQQQNRLVIAYVCSWTDQRLPNPMLMTNINYAFGHVNKTFNGCNVQNPDFLRKVVALKKINPKLKIQLSVGGWTSGNFSEMAADAKNRMMFAKDCARIVKLYGLDGGWVNKDNNQDIDMPKIAQMGRAHQPGLIMVDRTIHGEFENYQTPERTIPDTQLNYPWESCITLSNDWGWVPNATWKSPHAVVNILAEIVAKGGNLVLGVGPTPQGLIEPEAEKRLNEIGQWLNRYGKAIYNTTTTPIYNDKQLWFTASKDGKTRYAIYVLKDNETRPLSLRWRGNAPKSVQLLGTGQRLKMQKSGDVITVALPKTLKNEPFALQLNM